MKSLTVSQAQLNRLSQDHSIRDYLTADLLTERVDRKDSRRMKRERDRINQRRKTARFRD